MFFLKNCFWKEKRKITSCLHHCIYFSQLLNNISSELDDLLLRDPQRVRKTGNFSTSASSVVTSQSCARSVPDTGRLQNMTRRYLPTGRPNTVSEALSVLDILLQSKDRDTKDNSVHKNASSTTTSSEGHNVASPLSEQETFEQFLVVLQSSSLASSFVTSSPEPMTLRPPEASGCAAAEVEEPVLDDLDISQLIFQLEWVFCVCPFFLVKTGVFKPRVTKSPTPTSNSWFRIGQSHNKSESRLHID